MKLAFETAVEEAENFIVLILVKGNKEGMGVPVAVLSLLESYADALPVEIPPGLSPMRDIKHYVDLVPSSTILNKATLRLRPKEHEELR